MISGIYCIRNLIDNKRYVGQAINLDRRKYQHYYNLKNNTKYENQYLVNAYNKYGEMNLVFEILETVELTKDNNTNKYLLSLVESDWFCKYYPNVYNYHVVTNSPLGSKRSKETKMKMSVSISLSMQKAVMQLDKDNNILNIFNSLAIAGKVVGANPSHISKVCSGKAKTAGGYKWKYNI